MTPYDKLNLTRISLVLTRDLFEDRRMGDVAINNILRFYHSKQIDSMLPWVCRVIDHKGRRNEEKASVIFFLQHFNVIRHLLLKMHTATCDVFVK